MYAGKTYIFAMLRILQNTLIESQHSDLNSIYVYIDYI